MQKFLEGMFKFKVVENTPLGRACVATEKIIKNQIICKMAGPKITLGEFHAKYELDACGPLQIDNDLYIDLIDPYYCFNHSCNPNAGLRNNGILFALKDINSGEEIMYDYSTSVDEIYWFMECRCGSENCRKIIGDFQSIPHSQKEFYKQNNALMRHITDLYY